MYEIKRILLNKRVVIIFMIILLLNIVIFWNETEKENILDVKKPHNEYINDYTHKYEMVRKNAEMLLKGKEYSDENSFSARNIMKTLKDYEVTENITAVNTDEKAADSLIDFKFTDYAMVIFVISIIMSMYDERKKSIWDYVYSTKNGRKKLALYKLSALTAGVTAAAAIMYITNAVCAV